MTDNDKKEMIIGKLRQALEHFNCPREFLADRAERMAAHRASGDPHLELAVIEESVIDSSDPDGRREVSVPRVRVVDAKGAVVKGLNSEPLTVVRFVSDYVNHNPGSRWTLNPLVA